VPPFKWVEENGIEPKCLVYLTDLCCNSFPQAPDYPVLWVTESGRTGAVWGNGEDRKLGMSLVRERSLRNRHHYSNFSQPDVG